MNLLAVTALKVLMIGNSFSLSNIEHMPQICADMGLELELGSIYLGGCPISNHWNHAMSGQVGGPFRYDLYRGGKRVTEAPKKINIPEAVKSAKWDIITMQQASALSWNPATYQPYFDMLVKKVREWCPGAEIVIQETWSYTPFDNRLEKFGFDQNEMYNRLHKAYYDLAASYGFRVIPMGTAVQEWRKRLPVKYTKDSFGGDVVGGRYGKTLNSPKPDTFHLHERGEYFQGLVWTAKLFGVDVAKCKYRPEKIVTEAEAKLMVEIANDVASR